MVGPSPTAPVISADCRDGAPRATLQDDWVALPMTDLVDVERLMWANDFPHSDSTWPWSQELLAEHAQSLEPHVRDRIVHDNVAEPYAIA